MGKPLKVVVVGDAHGAALKVASDLESSGCEPSVFLAPGEADLERLAPGSHLIVACADATGVPPQRVLELAAQQAFPPVVVYAEDYTEDGIVALMLAGARDCLRRGDVERIRAAVERERGAAKRDKRLKRLTRQLTLQTNQLELCANALRLSDLARRDTEVRLRDLRHLKEKKHGQRRRER
jgi:hypothetical protein